MPFLRSRNKGARNQIPTDPADECATLTGPSVANSSLSGANISRDVSKNRLVGKEVKYGRRTKLFGNGTSKSTRIDVATDGKKRNKILDQPSLSSTTDSAEQTSQVGPLAPTTVTSEASVIRTQTTAPQTRWNPSNKSTQVTSNATITSQTINTASTTASSFNTSSFSSFPTIKRNNATENSNIISQQSVALPLGEDAPLSNNAMEQVKSEQSQTCHTTSMSGDDITPNFKIKSYQMQQQQIPLEEKSTLLGDTLSLPSNCDTSTLKSSSENGVVNNSGLGTVAMARSGWSVLSNASTAMNSENYIDSLDDLTSSPGVRSAKAFPVLNLQSDDHIRSALSRPFGRSHLPSNFLETWTVRVETPTWDPHSERYTYQINLTRNPITKTPNRYVPGKYNGIVSPSLYLGSDDSESGIIPRQQASTPASFNSAATTRTLQDFVWLERALRAEYHGALLVPLLSLALYIDPSSSNSGCGIDEDSSVTSKSLNSQTMISESTLRMPADGNVTSHSIAHLDDMMDRNEMVNASILSNWLSDIFNGVRGNGELLLCNRRDIVVDSEAIETFLFRHSQPLKEPSRMGFGMCRSSNLGSPFNLFTIFGEEREDGCNKSLFDNFIENPFTCFRSESANKTENSHIKMEKEVPISMICPSGTTGVPGIKQCHTNVSMISETENDLSGFQASCTLIASHSELLDAERDLIASCIKCSSNALTKIRALTKDESYIGQCWKRFAISLSHLFFVEKDLESAHIGEQIKSSKKNQPFRKLRKTAVDDSLRTLARRKIERAIPGLSALRLMLTTYYADLNSVVPAFKEYRDAINQLNELNETSSRVRHGGNFAQLDEWWSPFENLKAFTSTIVKQISGPLPDSLLKNTVGSETASDEGIYSLNTTQAKALQIRVLNNERVLKCSITSLCKSGFVRTARMAWWHLKTEAKQASNVHAAATALRQTLSIDADTAIAMKERNYDEDELKDNAAEIDLVRRILELRGNKVGQHTGNFSENEVKRQNALRLAMQRVGRWDADTALTIMEAAGVEDAEVQMDETSRELRHVRKFAISLRENVVRCREAAEALAASFMPKSEGSLQISRSRREFWAAMSTVYSCKLFAGEGLLAASSRSTRVLSSVGISTNDKGGWLGHSGYESGCQRRRCGEVARQYLKKRDNQANILISRILKLLREYEQRLEGVESFVYMHCVGIQLEKHCSKVRAKALSAWEKRTDISTAINVATKKRIPKLVQELKVKLEGLPQVSHTTVIKAKECHLTSKSLKTDLHKLANRRFGRAQEVSTERVIAIMSLWAKHEESVAIEEIRAIGETVQEIELSVERPDIDFPLDDELYSLLNEESGFQPGARHPSPAEFRSLLM